MYKKRALPSIIYSYSFVHPLILLDSSPSTSRTAAAISPDSRTPNLMLSFFTFPPPPRTHVTIVTYIENFHTFDASTLHPPQRTTQYQPETNVFQQSPSPPPARLATFRPLVDFPTRFGLSRPPPLGTTEFYLHREVVGQLSGVSCTSGRTQRTPPKRSNFCLSTRSN
jgi:hypothetical protein